jgi:predicted RNase H-like HicB family nuclease
MTKYHFTITIWEEDGVFVATCAELEVSSCGDSPQEALQNMREAITLYLENAKALGILPEIEEAMRASPTFTSTIEVDACTSSYN